MNSRLLLLLVASLLIIFVVSCSDSPQKPSNESLDQQGRQNVQWYEITPRPDGAQCWAFVLKDGWGRTETRWGGVSCKE